MTILLRQKPLPQVVRQIVQRDNGAWLDPSDMTTMFQDAAGTIPVTAVEQPVGKMLDKSGNGYHATQSITASRPTLSARYNLLTKTEDFTNAVWIKSGATFSGSTQPAPRSGAYMQKLVESVDINTTHRARYAVLDGVYTFSVYTKPNGRDFIWFGVHVDVLTHLFDIASGECLIGSGYVERLPDGIIRCVGYGITTSSGSGIYIGCATGGAVSDRLYTGDGISGAYVWGAHAQVGTSIGPYQRVNTATDYDTDERYFKKYLRFDGVDDYLNLPFMNLYGGGAASIVCARDAVSQATDTYIISERSTMDADPKYFPSRQLASAGNMDTYITDDAGAVVLDTVGSPFSGVANAVIRSIVDSGNNLKLFKNGVLAANDDYTRSGALTLNNTTIGASVSTTTSDYAAMKLYGLIVTKSALTDAQRVACERYLGRKSGVQL